MVFLQFPSKLTEEETMLQTKFAKLRKKKKQLKVASSSAATAKQQVDEFRVPSGDKSSTGAERGVKGDAAGQRGAKLGGRLEKSSSSSMTPMSAATKDAAKEEAKKMIRSGKISVRSSSDKERSNGFKRSQGLERKLTGSAGLGDSARNCYQPFSATHGPGGGFDTGGDDMMVLTGLDEDHDVSGASSGSATAAAASSPGGEDPPPAKKTKNLYDSFVQARDLEERGLPAPKGLSFFESTLGKGQNQQQNSALQSPADRHRQGHTIYVFGYNVTDEFLRDTFSPCGKIINISMEVEKNCGFVTFDKASSTERAINDYNGATVQSIQLKVSLARRQPVIDPINDASSSATWSTIAASHSQKGSHKDKRDLVAYDEDIF